MLVFLRLARDFLSVLILLLGFETSEHVSNVLCKSENNSGFAEDPLLASLEKKTGMKDKEGQCRV